MWNKKFVYVLNYLKIAEAIAASQKVFWEIDVSKLLKNLEKI